MAVHIFRPVVTILIRIKPSPQLRIHCLSRAPLLRGFLWVGLKVVLAVLLLLGQMFARHLRGADLHLLAVSSAVGEGRSARGD
jgi:hypothetical protein